MKKSDQEDMDAKKSDDQKKMAQDKKSGDDSNVDEKGQKKVKGRSDEGDEPERRMERPEVPDEDMLDAEDRDSEKSSSKDDEKTPADVKGKSMPKDMNKTESIEEGCYGNDKSARGKHMRAKVKAHLKKRGLAMQDEDGEDMEEAVGDPMNMASSKPSASTRYDKHGSGSTSSMKTTGAKASTGSYPGVNTSAGSEMGGSVPDKHRKKRKSYSLDGMDDTKPGAVSEAQRGKLPPGVLARVYWTEAQAADRMNRNRRIYKASHMPTAVENANGLAEGGQLFILGGHPKSKTQSFSEVAGIGRVVSYDESTGSVSLVADIINTREGRDVAAALAAGAALPVSSRATGKLTVEQRYSGRFGVFEAEDGPRRKPIFLLDNYKFIGWDLVPGIQSVPGSVARQDNIQMRHEATEQTSVVESAEDPTEDLMADKKLQERIDALEAEKLEMAARIEALEGECTVLAEQVVAFEAQLPEPEPTKDPVIEAMEREIQKLKSDKLFAEMNEFVDTLIGRSPYAGFADLIKPLVIREGYVPESPEVAEARFSNTEGYVKAVLSRARNVQKQQVSRPLPYKGTAMGMTRPAQQNEGLLVEADLAMAIGDTDDADSFLDA